MYSGQLVAQTELSVVTTLAPLTGWWNVVYTTPGGTSSLMRTRIDVVPASSPEFGPNEPGDAPGAVTLLVLPRRDAAQPGMVAQGWVK
jgi:hypothetical protein